MPPNLDQNVYHARVSSVLNKDVQNCGKQFMFDGIEETCWCSDQGTPQWVAIAFKHPVRLDSLCIQFQGGFVGKECEAIMSNANSEGNKIDFFPEDINTVQIFHLNSYVCEKLRVNFKTSTDFFGRIVIYNFQLRGEKV